MRMIDADELKDKARELIPNYHASVVMNLFDLIDNLADNMPTIDPVKHGKWNEYPIADGMKQCSVCGVLRIGDANYCPNCGSDMRGEQVE